jgi:hypothetical protein
MATTLTLGLVLACAVPLQEDRARVLAELGLPEGSSCPDLARDPTTPGTFGREGLRLQGTCTPPAGWAPAGWSSAWPAAADQFHRGPGLWLPAGGEVYCVVGVWRTGQSFDPHPCASPPAKFDHYRLAVWDPAAREVRFVLQNYY